MKDFLLFESFISQYVLITIYYIGAFALIPSLLLFRRFVGRFDTARRLERAFGALWNSLDFTDRVKAVSMLFTLFLFMQICWRILFEILIAYFDMHDYLQSISKLQN